MDETAIAQRHAATASSENSTLRSRWIGEQLSIVALCTVGKEPDRKVLRAYAASLDDLSDQQLHAAFTRARHELKFFPSVAELRHLAGVGEEQQKAAAVAAWDTLLRFVDKNVWHNGNCYVADNTDTLDARIRTTARLAGGWEVLKCMTKDDYPHVQKRFVEQFLLHDVIQAATAANLLPPPRSPSKALAAPPTPTEAPTSPAPQLKTAGVIPRAEPSDEELRNRRAMLLQQAADLRKKHSGKQEAPCSNTGD